MAFKKEAKQFLDGLISTRLNIFKKRDKENFMKKVIKKFVKVKTFRFAE